LDIQIRESTVVTTHRPKEMFLFMDVRRHGIIGIPFFLMLNSLSQRTIAIRTFNGHTVDYSGLILFKFEIRDWNGVCRSITPGVTNQPYLRNGSAVSTDEENGLLGRMAFLINGEVHLDLTSGAYLDRERATK
jgi:hypothetical protein